jgi:hypothetical protein
MGLGTPFRESLSSYYLALAHLHHLSPRTLAKELIIPPKEDGAERQGDDAFTSWKLSLFNGIGAVPGIWAKRLGELTGRNDLIDLTLVPLRPYTHRQRLMSAKKRWCPLCLAEAEKEGRVYGHLLWEIASVQACPKHGVNLVSQCNCSGTGSPSTGNKVHLPGICGLCGYSLTQNYGAFLKSASEDEIIRSKLIAELLGDMERLKGGAPGISEFLRNAMHHFTKDNAALFGRILGIKKNTLHGWIHNGFVPSFPQIVEIALACRCSVADVMLGLRITFGKAEPAYAQSRVQKPFRTKRTTTLDRDNITRQLGILLSVVPPISVSEAAVKVGINRRTLFMEFRDIAQRISQRFKEYRSAEKTRKFADKCDLYRQSAVRLIQRGVMPTPRRVASNIRGKRVIIKDRERATCSAICEEVIQKRSRLFAIYDNQNHSLSQSVKEP